MQGLKREVVWWEVRTYRTWWVPYQVVISGSRLPWLGDGRPRPRRPSSTSLGKELPNLRECKSTTFFPSTRSFNPVIQAEKMNHALQPHVFPSFSCNTSPAHIAFIHIKHSTSMLST